MNFDVRKDFRDFCRSTSLHGWHHLTDNAVPSSQRENQAKSSKTKGGGKLMWFLIVSASIGVASFFLFTSVSDFTSKYVATSIDTTTASLHVSIIVFLLDNKLNLGFQEIFQNQSTLHNCVILNL